MSPHRYRFYTSPSLAQTKRKPMHRFYHLYVRVRTYNPNTNANRFVYDVAVYMSLCRQSFTIPSNKFRTLVSSFWDFAPYNKTLTSTDTKIIHSLTSKSSSSSFWYLCRRNTFTRCNVVQAIEQMKIFVWWWWWRW